MFGPDRFPAAVPAAMALALLLAACPVSAQDPPYAPGELLLKFAPGVAAAQADGLLAELGAREVRAFPRTGAVLVRLQGRTVKEAVAAFARRPGVLYLEPNYTLSADVIPHDPDFPNLWGMHNVGQTGGTADADIDAPEAWDTTVGSEAVLVAVIDTGVDTAHPDLAANIWTNPGEVPGNGLDDDGNGWVDDLHGWDALHQDGDPMDDNGHGTHVAGTIGAVGDNGAGVAGVCWNVRLMALKFLGATGTGTTAGAIECIEYAVAMGAGISNNSWGGGGFSLALQDAIALAADAGQIFVAAAGNFGRDNDLYPHYPSSYGLPNVVAVGATDHHDQAVSNSLWATNTGLTAVDIGAPGDEIFSTVPGGGYDFMSGTSMATPHVSGALALAKSRFPGLTTQGAVALLLNSADKPPQLAGKWVSEGRLNAAAMLAGPDTIPPAAVGDLEAVEIASSWVDLAWTATGDDGASGTAATYDLRFALFPIDETNFETSDRLAESPVPLPAGQRDDVRVDGLAFATTYYFALRAGDEYGNASPVSNLAGATTLGVPALAIEPASLAVALGTGGRATETLTVANVGDGVLDFAIRTVPADSTAGEKSIGVGGFGNQELLPLLLADPQLAGQFTFVPVDYTTGDLSALDGLIVAEVDGSMTNIGATALRNFYDSGRPIFLGMDDLDNGWRGIIPGLLGPAFGIEMPLDGDFCTGGPVNANHPILAGISAVAVGGAWCNENDHYLLDGADWLFQDGATGFSFGVAYSGTARTVLMGENLADVWTANPRLNTNAMRWLFADFGLPTVEPAGGSLAAGEVVPVTVTFDAAWLCDGDFSSHLVVANNDPARPETVVPAQVLVTGEPDLAVADSLLDFGGVFQDGSAGLDLTIANIGCDLLRVLSVEIEPDDFTTEAAPFDLAVGQQRVLAVTYAPTGLLPVTGTLTLTANDPDRPVVTVTLRGEGRPAPVIAVAPASLAADLTTGQADTRALTIRNLGGSDLEFSLKALQTAPLKDPDEAADPGRVINAEKAAAAAPVGQAYAAGVLPSRDRLPVPAGEAIGDDVLGVAGAGLEVLIVGAGTFLEIQAELQAFDDVAKVDVFESAVAVPTLADLSPYHVVVLASGYAYPDPVGLGDALADYLDQGGAVVQTLATFLAGYDVAGRFRSGGYSAFGTGAGPIGASSLGAFDAAHPVMDGVTGGWGDLLAVAPLAPGAQWVASWGIGQPCVATQGDRVVGVNVFLPDYGYWTGDIPRIVHNAALWAAGGSRWLRTEPRRGTVPAQGQLDVAVTFDAATLCGGTYQGDLVIQSNDPLSPRSTVGALMTVTGAQDIAVGDTLLGFGAVYLGAVAVDTLEVANLGCELLIIDTVGIDNPEFAISTNPIGLLPGRHNRLPVTFTPGSPGPKTGTLTLHSDDPDQPVVTVTLTATAVDPPVAGVSPPSFAVDLVPGQVAARILSVINSGAADLTWSVSATVRDGAAEPLAKAAAAAVSGLRIVPGLNADGERITAVAPDQIDTLRARLAAYTAATAPLAASGAAPEVGVGGAAALDLMVFLLADPGLAGRFVFTPVDYVSADLSGLAGLVIAEFDFALDDAKAMILRNFWDSGRPIVMGMDDLDDDWHGLLPNLLGPVFGIDLPYDANLCTDPVLSPLHPIATGLPGFVIGGQWCNDNDAYRLAGAQWLVQDGGTRDYHCVAQAWPVRTVLIGENLAGVWQANAAFNAGALAWALGVRGLPGFEPASGTVAPGTSQQVAVTFDAAYLCGGTFATDIVLASNDPLHPSLNVPADLRVGSQADIALADSLLDYGEVFTGAVSPDTLWIGNGGCGPLTISSLTVSSPDFHTESGPLTVGPDGTYPLVVRYQPTASGAATGVLTIACDDPDEGVLTVVLEGSAVPGPAMRVTPLDLSVVLEPGAGTTRLLTVANEGVANLTWSLGVVRRDSLAARLRSSAAAVVAGMRTDAAVDGDGSPVRVLGAGQAELLAARMIPYTRLVRDLQAAQGLPVIGVAGTSWAFLYTLLLDNPRLTSLYGFVYADYARGDLEEIDGLILAETDANLDPAKAAVLRAFVDGGRPLFLGMDDLDEDWTPEVATLLSPAFGIDAPADGDLCYNPLLNDQHPITAGIPVFTAGGEWCNDNDHYQVNGGTWLFRDGDTFADFGVANQGTARTVLMGENLAFIWFANEDLNTQAVIWMMDGGGLPAVFPAAGVVTPGQSAEVEVAFQVPAACGPPVTADILVFSDDPAQSLVAVPADLVVASAPRLALSDTAITFGPVTVGLTGRDTLVVSNTGCEVLQVSGVSIAPDAFSVATAPFALAVGESRALAVAFTPPGVGPVSGTLTLTTGNPPTGQVAVALAGEGLPPSAIRIAPDSLAFRLSADAVQARWLTLADAGAGELTFAATTRLLTAAIAGTEAAAGGDSTGLSLLLLGSGALGPLQAELLAFAAIDVVDVFDTRSAAPVPADLSPYQVVVLANSHPFFDPAVTGDAVAAFVDQGGGVIQTELSFLAGYNVTGRFWDEGYSAFALGADQTGVGNLGSFQAGHPIMAGVASTWGDLLSDVPLAAEAELIASWDDGRPFVAAKGGRVVGVNVFVADPGHWSGGVARVLCNAALWVAGTAPWLDLVPSFGTVPPGGSLDLQVVCGPAGRPEGDYRAEILITSNDPLAGSLAVPVLMQVRAGTTPLAVRIDAVCGQLQDTHNVLAMTKGAADGYDVTLDQPEPPPPPPPALVAYFPHPEWGLPLGARFRTDYRALIDPGVERRTWDFRVETDGPDSVMLAFMPSFTRDSGWPFVLQDHAAGLQVDLWPDLRYTFAPIPAGNAFTIALGAPLPALLPAERVLPAGWSLVGPPLVPPAGQDTWGDVLPDGAAAGTALFAYRGEHGYGAVAALDTVRQGQGLWAAAPDSFTWFMAGVPDTGRIVLAARQGWNLLGYPLWFAGDLAGSRVFGGGSLYTWPEAALAGLVTPVLFAYDGVGGSYVPTTSLQPWHGYWLAVHQPDVAILWDYREMLAAASAAASAAAVAKIGVGQPWLLAVSAVGGPSAVSFGTAVGAGAGFDAAWDLPLPPSSPAGPTPTELAILHPEWSLACGERFGADLREPGPGPFAWELTLTAAGPGPVDLNWDSTALPPEIDLEIYLPGENRVVIGSVREASAASIQVGAEPVAVLFRTPSTVTEVPWRPQDLRLRNVPNPFNPGTEFRFELPRQGMVEIRIYDLRGAVTRRLAAGVLPAGPGILRWDGADGRNGQAASGTYFYRLYLDGRQLGSTAKMSLIK